LDTVHYDNFVILDTVEGKRPFLSWRTQYIMITLLVWT